MPLGHRLGLITMADQNKYLRYKRDTKHLIHWIINASNRYVRFNVPDGLVQSSALVTWENCADGSDSIIRDSGELPGTEKPPLMLNTTGNGASISSRGLLSGLSWTGTRLGENLA